MIGYWAGGNNVDGQYNAFLGWRAGQGNNGSNNVFLGYQAGEGTAGSGNVFVGHEAGYFQGTRSNQLYISNSNTSTPLIWGDFANTRIKLDGNVGAGGYSAYESYGLVVRGGTTNSLRVYTSAGQTGSTLYVSGSIYATGTITSGSDKRFKKNVNNIEGALDKVLSLNGVNYEWRTPDEIQSFSKQLSENEEEGLALTFPEGKQIGLVAQDVEEIIPEIVFTDEEGFKSVDYTKLGPVLIEAIKEQQKQIEALKKEIEVLKQQK